jgi:hypothetical protein
MYDWKAWRQNIWVGFQMRGAVDGGLDASSDSSVKAQEEIDELIKLNSSGE